MNKYNKKITLTIIVLFIGLSFIPGVTEATYKKEQTNQITLYQKFSNPIIEENEQYINLVVKEAESYTTNQGGPKLPVFTKTYELPFGTEITNIECIFSDIETIKVSKKIEPVATIQPSNNKIILTEREESQTIYDSNNPYPGKQFSYRKGVGLNKNKERVLYLTININPVRYRPNTNIVEYISDAEVIISYKETPSVNVKTTIDQYDLVIITPAEFCYNLQPLITHKNRCGIKTNVTCLNTIYTSYPGRDEPEKIKCFIKDAVEQWDIKYVLLIGDINKLPIREAHSHFWSDWEGHILSDLYYADIYDENYSFCNWDANENDIFGEVEYGNRLYNISIDNIDKVDLYPDICIGRLPCSNYQEVDIVVNKIITYEKTTYDSIWFKNIVLAGGDTFPVGLIPLKDGIGLPFIYEGEITNTKVAQQLPDFSHKKLWTSKHNLNAVTFNRAINKGAGFVSYAGHGFEHGWSTYRPNSLRGKMDITQPIYYTPYIKLLRNQNKLPIIFFDACLTAKLDFTFGDLIHYKAWSFLEILTKLPNIEKDMMLPVLAWAFVKKDNGGAIATIGATRSAYTWVDNNGVHAGAGYLDVHFFKAYEEGITLGEMLVQAKKDYINNVGEDFFTIEEFILLGDPSLMVGGYPQKILQGEQQKSV